ncbi:hypothetical protein KVR01_007986 [Diaporthe batatas]|uniref:uncharacterized protein n=1 Tax=Diaporthe batatas TaxID=748121 RepID=UPI001D0500C2|nr:uncharacterized protein KVR01_007986 [Diaporthe batatas]KAG8162221.1 hypothetical protein KVR01_007986 [Diaporthe batatas]
MSSTASNPTFLVFFIGVVTLLYFVACKIFGHDPREPPLAPQSIPVIGHMLGLSRSKFNYYYVLNNIELIQTVQRQHKILAFPPIEAKFASTVCGVSHGAQAILAKNVNGDDGDFGLSMESYAAMRAAVKPGPQLDDMNHTMIQETVNMLDSLQPANAESKKIGMYGWLRDAITTATTRSVYGPMSPYDDKAVADAFWEFESGLVSILVGILPSITARKAIAARAKVAKAFEEYYKAGGVKKASAYARLRYQTSIDNNLSLEDIARFEVGGSMPVLVNTTPAAFWTLLFFFSHPGLLAEIRQEIDACTKTTNNKDGTIVKSIDITALKEACPLMLSSYQEVLRYTSMGTSVREVMEDTYLDRWLLKKGAMLQMPSRVIHQDASLWGKDVAEFDPRRFLSGRKDRPRNEYFRAFGGGKTLCPGRHFATNEVLSVAAVFVARLDMKPVGGEWKHPTTRNTNVAAAIMEPDHDIEVEITTREGFEGVKWEIGLRSSDRIFALVSEDSAQS